MSRFAMVQRYRILIGVLIGLVASAAVLSVFDGAGGGTPTGGRGERLLSDCDGPLEDVVIHYMAEASGIVMPAYRDFLGQLPADVTVHVVCPDRAALDDLRARLGDVPCKVSPVVVDHPITPWSRDRWLALASAGESTATLLSPRGEMGAEVWPGRAGDQRTGDDLAAALGPNVVSVRSDLYFDGGDFVADHDTVFVTPAVLPRNLQRTVRTREELTERLATLFQRKVVLLDEAPDHHAGMYMMAVGNGTMLVGDPAAARRLLGTNADGLCPPDGPDFTPETIARFDAVADQCRAAGYRVVRIPIVPGLNGRTYVTYVNAILERRAGRRIVYMPVFSRASALNSAARHIWSELGYEVREVNCDACYPHFGSLRCLVNILRRG